MSPFFTPTLNQLKTSHKYFIYYLETFSIRWYILTLSGSSLSIQVIYSWKEIKHAQCHLKVDPRSLEGHSHFEVKVIHILILLIIRLLQVIKALTCRHSCLDCVPVVVQRNFTLVTFFFMSLYM